MENRITDLNKMTALSRDNDGYDILLSNINETFNQVCRSSHKLFKVQSDRLWYKFLAAIPEDARKHYNCNTCHNFVRRYGGLVTINDDGSISSALWDVDQAPEFFKPAIKVLKDNVENSKVINVFVPERNATTLGTCKCNGFNHFSAKLPESHMYKDRLSSLQKEAEYRELRRMIIAALNDYTIPVIKKAISMLESGQLIKGLDFASNARWFLILANKWADNDKNKANFVWKAIAEAPTGFCHIKSTMIGTLLDDIKNGADDMYDIIGKFNAKMDPLKYYRPQAAPTSGSIKRAEEIFAELGLESALGRRYASIKELKYIWTPDKEDKNIKSDGDGIFSHLMTKDKKKEPNLDNLIPTMKVSMSKFMDKILPNAEKINLIVDRSIYNMAFFTTATDPEAKPIIKWDKLEKRNPVSTYIYNKGTSAINANIKDNTEVIGVCYSPERWTDLYTETSFEDAIIFIINGAKDVKGLDPFSNIGLGIFPSILIPELREVRSVIEAYSKNGRLGDSIDSTYAAGVCFNKGMTDINLKFKVRDKDLHEDKIVIITSWES